MSLVRWLGSKMRRPVAAMLSWWQKNGLFDSLTLVGLVALVVGANVALDVHSPYPLVAAGAVLLVLGIFGRDWEELWGEWGDRKLGLRRRALAENADKIANELDPTIDSIEDLLTAPGLSEDVKTKLGEVLEELDEKRREVEDLATQLATHTGRSRRRRQNFRATHQFGRSQISLRLEAPAHHTFSTVECTVIGPNGVFTAIPNRMARVPLGGPKPSIVYVDYPADFSGAAFSRGEYQAVWRGNVERHDPILAAITETGFKMPYQFSIGGLEQLLKEPIPPQGPQREQGTHTEDEES